MSLPHLLIGTTREHYILLFGAAGSIGLLSAFVGSSIGAFFGARRAGRLARRAAAEAALSQPQLEPILQALDAIALEVERISEAQRFTTKVLAERGAVPPMGQRAALPSITPH
jgi:hypothetical protein